VSGKLERISKEAGIIRSYYSGISQRHRT